METSCSLESPPHTIAIFLFIALLCIMSGAADGRAVLLVLAVQPAPIMFPVLLEEGPVNHPPA